MVEQRSPKPSMWVQLLLSLCNLIVIMAVLVKWLTHWFVDPAYVGSIPTYRPLLGYSQVVRQRTLTPSCAGSNPATPIAVKSTPGGVAKW